MNDLGLELLNLVEARQQEGRENDERTWKQLARFSSKLEKARGKFGQNLESLAEELRKNRDRKGLSAKLIRIFLPWRQYTEKRQLKLVEVLLAWHQSESQEMMLAFKALEGNYDGNRSNEKPLK